MQLNYLQMLSPQKIMMLTRPRSLMMKAICSYTSYEDLARRYQSYFFTTLVEDYDDGIYD